MVEIYLSSIKTNKKGVIKLNHIIDQNKKPELSEAERITIINKLSGEYIGNLLGLCKSEPEVVGILETLKIGFLKNGSKNQSVEDGQ